MSIYWFLLYTKKTELIESHVSGFIGLVFCFLYKTICFNKIEYVNGVDNIISNVMEYKY